MTETSRLFVSDETRKRAIIIKAVVGLRLPIYFILYECDVHACLFRFVIRNAVTRAINGYFSEQSDKYG